MILTASLPPVLPAQTRSPAVQGGRAAIDFAGSFAQAHAVDAALAPDLHLSVPALSAASPVATPDAPFLQKAAAPGNVLPIALPADDLSAGRLPGIVAQAPTQALAASKSALLPANALTPDAVEADPPVVTVERAAIAAPVARVTRSTPFVGLPRGPRAKDHSPTDGTGTTEADTNEADRDQPDKTAASVDTPVDMPVVLPPIAPSPPIIAVALGDTARSDEDPESAAAPPVLSPSLAGLADATPPRPTGNAGPRTQSVTPPKQLHSAAPPASAGEPLPVVNTRIPPAATPAQMAPVSPAQIMPAALGTASTSPTQAPPVPDPGLSPAVALPLAGLADAALTPTTSNAAPRTQFVWHPTPPKTAGTPATAGAPLAVAAPRIPPAVTPGKMPPVSPAQFLPTAMGAAPTRLTQTPPVLDPGLSPAAALPLAELADAALTSTTGNAAPRTQFVPQPMPPQTAGTPAAAGAPLAVADTRIPPAATSDQMPPVSLSGIVPAAMAANPTMPIPAPPAVAVPLVGTALAEWTAPPALPQPREAVAVPVSPDTPIGTPRWVSTGATTPVALAVTTPGAVQPQPGTVASASQVFGAAIRAATKPRDDRDAADPSMVSPTAGAPVSAPTIATAATQQAPLDMRQDRWPHAMIERIEILRDAANAGDTRIRLVPDALGAIDVSLKQDGDTVHVHFHAEQGATRALLQEAQPRLVELAEARGLKLGQGGLGDSGGPGNGQPRAPTTPQAPNRTPSHPAPATIVASPDDTRIA